MARTSLLEDNDPKGVDDPTILYLKILRQTSEILGISSQETEPNLRDSKRSLVQKWLQVWKEKAE